MHAFCAINATGLIVYDLSWAYTVCLVYEVDAWKNNAKQLYIIKELQTLHSIIPWHLQGIIDPTIPWHNTDLFMSCSLSPIDLPGEKAYSPTC